MTPARDDTPRRRLGRGAYRTRDDAYPQPLPLRVGDNEMRVVNERATAVARPNRSRSDPLTGLPSRKPMRVVQSAELQPGPGEGVVSVVADTGVTAPVIAVDGVPVAVGNGQLDLVVSAGPHTVEVQNTATVDPVVVEVAEHGAHQVQYFENGVSGHRVLGELPVTAEFIPTNAGCWSWLVVVS